MGNGINELYIDILKQEVKPALGCTEPMAVALAVAKACELICQRPQKVVVEVSPNIFKNGMGVGIPGTGMVGLDIAVALGVVCGKSEYGLEVINEVCADMVSEAKEYIASGGVEIKISESKEKLYIVACAYSPEHNSKVIISGRHDNISYLELDLEPIKVEQQQDNTPKSIDIIGVGMTVKTIWDFVESVDIEKVRFILEAKTLNMRLAKEGLEKEYGLRVGKSLYFSMNGDYAGNSLPTYAMSLTAAASDARMDGCLLPAMSNSGSGNQGITVTMPVVAIAERLNVSENRLIRALVLSHLVAIHIKSYLGRLSALCGCIVASSGAACGITYLNGGEYNQVVYSLKNMIGNISGMICDGAKTGCALKVATGVSCAMQSSLLALGNICISANDGIIDNSVEQTIKNLGIVGTEGMSLTDKVLMEIMVNKCN